MFAVLAATLPAVSSRLATERWIRATGRTYRNIRGEPARFDGILASNFMRGSFQLP